MMSAPASFSFTIPGVPVAKGRPRFVVRRGFASAYTPKKTRDAEDTYRAIASRAWARDVLTRDTPVDLYVEAVMPIPSTWSKRKRQDAIDGKIHPTKRPDFDNMLKAATDALNGVVYEDDSAIVRCTFEKKYGASPKLIITLTW